MKKKQEDKNFEELPRCAAEYINLVIKLMRYRRKVREDVRTELAAHFEDALKDCRTNEEKEKKAQTLITEFGDAKMLAILTRRAKKRCRPLWRTVAARTFQTIGVLILCFTIYTAWFLTGKPNMSVDYLERWNEISKPEVINGDNAWGNYEKTVELFIEPNDAIEEIIKQYFIKFTDLNEPQQRQITEWVEKNEAAWNEFVKGSLRPYYYGKASYGGDPNDPYNNWLLNVHLPHLHTFRILSRLGIWHSKITLKSGKTEQALEDCLTIVRAGSHLQSKGGFFEKLVRIGMTVLGCRQISAIIAEEKLSAVTLAELHKKLRKIYPKGYPEMDIEGERLSFLDTVQQIFTDGGPGGGHLIPRYILPLETFMGSYDDESDKFMVILHTGASMIHARRNETIVQGNKVYDKMAEIVKMSPYERHVSRVNSKDSFSDLSRYRYHLFEIFMPAINRISLFRYEAKASYEALLTLLTLQRWQIKKGSYPDNLEQLVAQGYLEQLPMDPFSNKPLVYKKTDEGFTLHSIGRNFVDDGGVTGKDKEGKPKMWADNGDTVFWPVTQ